LRGLDSLHPALDTSKADTSCFELDRAGNYAPMAMSGAETHVASLYTVPETLTEAHGAVNGRPCARWAYPWAWPPWCSAFPCTQPRRLML